MTAERWQQVKSIFHGALEIDPPARARFVLEHCGEDDELRLEVESLLASEQTSDSALDHPIVGEYATSERAPGTPFLNDRYEVERELGRGGMSVVYLARDRQLLAKRVVIKVLQEARSLDPWMRQKFLQEMEALARIDHPGVVGVLDTGLTTEGKRFLVMQFIEGATLRSAIEPGGMNFARAADFIRQIGQALGAAHDKGVWHRDLKPENIMLQCLGGQDHVKLIDFGIAGIQDSQFSGEETKVAGSASYMAPELFSGHACAASDTYALGVVAYEILTGTLPGETGKPRPKLPEAAERSIRKAMSFAPELRHARTREFSEELYHALTGGEPGRTQDDPESSGKAVGTVSRAKSKVLLAGVVVVLVAAALADPRWLGRGEKSSAPSGDIASIAVLPFADNSPGKNQEYFSDGLTEELLNALATIRGLRVAGRTSSFQFKGKTEDLREIGRKLNVTTILEGSVGQQGNRTRVTTRLVKASDGFQIWSASFDREVNDIFAVQEEIARAVAAALNVRVLAGKTRAPSARNTNFEAYNEYLQGRYFLVLRNQENLRKAVEYFERSINLDPGYAPAWAELAVARTSQASSAYIPMNDGYWKAREEVDRALRLDANLPEAHAALGTIKITHDWDWAGAAASFQRALALEPGNAEVIRSAASLANNLGRLDEAIALIRRSIEIDPLNNNAYHNLGIILYYTGQNTEAAAAFRHALELSPARTRTHCLLGRVYLVQSHPQEALVEMEQEKNPPLRLFGLALAYHALRRKKDSDASLTELIEKFSVGNPYQIAEAYAFREETDKAFEWLERAYTERDSGLREIKSEPLLSKLRSDPRYTGLLQKMHLPL